MIYDIHFHHFDKKVVETRAGPLLIRVDQGPIHLLSLRVRRLLMQTLEGRMSIPEFMEAYLARYKRPCSMELVRQNLEDVVEVCSPCMCLICLAGMS